MKLRLLLIGLTLLAGSLAFPRQEDDMSIFFDHTNPDARIVGGIVAAEPVPWMVALTTGIFIRSFMCGASIVTDRHILTAAHCIEGAFSWGSLTSSLRGTVGTNRWNSGGVSYAFARNVTHPHYLSSIIKNDLGLLVTSTSIIFNNVIAPVTLNFDETSAGVATTVNGWGRIRTGGALSTQLLELHSTTMDGLLCMIQVPLIAQEISFPTRPPPVEPQIEICTFHNVDYGTCNGDSGSALLKRDNRQQIGIVSWGIPCARGAPDMFVRVSAYKSWLESSIL